jgi:hypothetical protein
MGREKNGVMRGEKRKKKRKRFWVGGPVCVGAAVPNPDFVSLTTNK